jgi:asparagine synthase (glutamine-hydrolysing)
LKKWIKKKTRDCKLLQSGKTTNTMKEEAKQLNDLLTAILGEISINEDTGIMLSGGLDSSSVVCLLLSKGKKLRSISASFKGFSIYDETEYVEAIKEKYPQLEVNYFSPIEIDLIEELKKLMEIIKEPITSGSPLLQYLLLKKAKELGMKNLIYCQGPDELMGGYDPFLLAKAKEDFLRFKISDGIINFIEYIKRSKMVGTDLILLRAIKFFITSKDLKTEMKKSLPNLHHLISIAQKTAQSLGIQLILPYMDQRIIEFCQSLDSDNFIFRGQTKVILREAMADVLPEKILKRKKKFGFFAPDSVWLLKNRKKIETIKDDVVLKEYKKFLKNPNKRWYKQLWIALSNHFLKK